LHFPLTFCVKLKEKRFIDVMVGEMPSLFRLLFVLGILAGIVYGGMVALTVFVEPNPREMTVKIPAKRLNPQ